MSQAFPSTGCTPSDFKKALAIEEIAHGDAELMAQFKVCSDDVAAQVKVSVLHADIVAPVCIGFDGEWGGERCVEDGELRNVDFNVARG